MRKSAFWTQRRFAGMALILGCCLFLGAAGLIPRDAQGNFMVNLPLRKQLLVIATQSALLQWSFSLFISGLIVTLLGLSMLTVLLRDTGDRTVSSLPLGAAPVAGQETVRTSVVADAYLLLTLWAQPLFVIYPILAFSALAAYGGAIFSTRVLPHWLGWLSIVYGGAGLVLLGFTTGNVPPFLHHLMPIVMGIPLLFLASWPYLRLFTRAADEAGGYTTSTLFPVQHR